MVFVDRGQRDFGVVEDSETSFFEYMHTLPASLFVRLWVFLLFSPPRPPE